MTKRQQKLLDFMVAHWQKTGVPPSIREMCQHMHVSSPNGVMSHLLALQKQGYVTNTGNHGSHCWRPKHRRLDVTCLHCGGEIEVTEELG